LPACLPLLLTPPSPFVNCDEDRIVYLKTGKFSFLIVDVHHVLLGLAVFFDISQEGSHHFFPPPPSQLTAPSLYAM
jgi:hypothetical protein